MNIEEIVFIDTEISRDGKTVLDIGAVSGDGREFHSGSASAFIEFIRDFKYICGHNIIKHDLIHLKEDIKTAGVSLFIDTLHFSPLLFPKKPYHDLVKDDKLSPDEINNPLNDSKKARDLFFDEHTAFTALKPKLRNIFHKLLSHVDEFRCFFEFCGLKAEKNDVTQEVYEDILAFFSGKICVNAPIRKMIVKYPAELAYALALINVIEHDSATPPWVLRNYPRVENVIRFLRRRQCRSCSYCETALDVRKALKRYFDYDEFRIYDGIPLQEEAVIDAINDESIIVVFPTGGGKSITFQLPALMVGEIEKGLTVVISPLQSLMKDQTDNLEKQHNITNAVTINGSIDPLERAKSYERVEDGTADILYISPESLRSKSIERLLLCRNVVRFVIDEAHCFSSWGHDFRVDYLYIGDFISNLQTKKNMSHSIPVSCFTATAKQKVIADIKNYFKDKLSLELKEHIAGSKRSNLSYHIFSEENEDMKDELLRDLLQDKDCPTIIYVSRVRTTEILANKLTADGFPAKPYNGKMDKAIRVENQDAFMNGDVKIIVATTAFGMGVDKKDVGMVIHYDISDSLENYIQEAGRAGRDDSIDADCYVLYTDNDLDKHFIMLNQTKLTQKEIQQVWRAVKSLTSSWYSVTGSALEIARAAGWDDSVSDIDTRVTTAINALEQAKFLRRGQNMPRIYADSILVESMEDAATIIDKSIIFDDKSRLQAIRIIKNLISARSKARGEADDGESRVDYISDRLGIVKNDVVRVIGLLREEKILADAKDLVAYIKKNDGKNLSKMILSLHMNIERFLLETLKYEETLYNVKSMNEALQMIQPDSSLKNLQMILNYYAIKNYITRHSEENKNYVTIKPKFPLADIQHASAKRFRIAESIIDYLYGKAIGNKNTSKSNVAVAFSILELKEEYENTLFQEKTETADIEDAIYYLLKIGAMRIEGGFLVIYNAMRIERLRKDSNVSFGKSHYSKLNEHYKHKRQQIHIVGEYAKRLSEDHDEAMNFLDDYFVMDYEQFLQKYFKGRKKEIARNITQKKFNQVFGELSPAQLTIIDDEKSKSIVVAAGPGSGKTKLLTHKLAALYMMEDVKHEQMLMLTFSRAATTEFKMRLMKLIGNAAHFIQIMTFHSYCFDLLGRVGDLEKSDNIIIQAVEKIKADEVDVSRITKTVLVIDEAQDMSEAEYSLVMTLKEKNSDMSIIAVGDDDQNIYEWRRSNSVHFESLLDEKGAKKYELIDNYRSAVNLVEFANQYAKTIHRRFKTSSIKPVRKEYGDISICKMVSSNIEIAVVNAVQKIKPIGTTCIITKTNDEAMNIVGLLTKRGIAAKQIQSNNGFNLYDLIELRDFVDFVNEGDNAYTISGEIWDTAISKLSFKYGASTNLHGVLRLLDDFDSVNNKVKYLSDLKQFIRESNLEDFIPDSASSILVSTIHQTKGREFDNVFLTLSSYRGIDDAIRRAIYVAITRAKENLFIFASDNQFDRINVKNINHFIDKTDYPQPDLITLQLTHRDVQLGYFRHFQKTIDTLISGQSLSINEIGCLSKDKQILKFSAKFLEDLKKLREKGYTPTKAYIRYIVYWRDKNKTDENEIKIILPNLELARITD